jgi:hypothetical protein
LSKKKGNRAEVIDLALYATRLLSPEYFNDFQEAIYAKVDAKIKFMTVCEKAQIPVDKAEQLYAGITNGFAEEKMWWI